MYKIVTAVNSMVERANLISNVYRSNTGELYFIYDGKFTWSIYKDKDGNYFLHYYPGTQSSEELANLDENVWAVFSNYITYRTTDIKTKEAVESFSELYQTVQGKLYSIDDVLDQIINTAAH